MTISLIVFPTRVEILARLEDPVTGTIGDLRHVLHQGRTGSWHGYTYDQLHALGTGQHQLTNRATTQEANQ